MYSPDRNGLYTIRANIFPHTKGRGVSGENFVFVKPFIYFYCACKWQHSVESKIFLRRTKFSVVKTTPCLAAQAVRDWIAPTCRTSDRICVGISERRTLLSTGNWLRCWLYSRPCRHPRARYAAHTTVIKLIVINFYSHAPAPSEKENKRENKEKNTLKSRA